MNIWFKPAQKYLSLLCLFMHIAQPACATSFSDIKHKTQQLDAEFIKASAMFYQDISSYPDNSLRTFSEIAPLLEVVKKLSDTGQSVNAIRLIHSNTETIINNLDTEAIFILMELLLNNNEWKLANTLFTDIKNEGDQSILATVRFIFAKYYASRNQWLQVNKSLKGTYTELSEENGAYAYLLNGSALQHLKKHRQAISSYNKIRPDSRYYRYAQLNIAIANIRQGWWTDAQTKIKGLIKQSNENNNDELTNRLNLVLGYALLQREYYRDARDAFRNIKLNSRYSNRALLGIGLTATSQGDYIGGLNALSILKDKKTFDLSVEESYLLIPYVYEKLQQELTVTTSYTEAMNYYQRRINRLNDISSQHKKFTNATYKTETSDIIIKNNSFDYGSQYTEAFINNYRQLATLKKRTANKTIKLRLSKLLSEYDKVYQDIINSLISKRVTYLKSYLNQSKYGLARLYDSTKQTEN